MSDIKTEYLPNYTYEDYKQWEGRWELIRGIPYAMAPAPMIRHQHISNKIAWQLQESVQDCSPCKALLPIDWKIDETTIVQPDNLVICHQPPNEAFITRAPVLIFEILSKSTALKDRNLKYELYEKEGVKYYIMVDPNDNIAKVYRLKDGKYIKEIDAADEQVTFRLEACEIAFDFSRLW